MKTIVLALTIGLSVWLVEFETTGFSEVDRIAHGGGTDKCGCHTNRTTGEYHCHTRKQRGGDCPPQLERMDDTPDTEESESSEGQQKLA